MKTTLEIVCGAFGWQGGTIHDAKKRFAVATSEEMDRICGLLSEQISDISDPRTAIWFMDHRMEAIGLHVRAV